MSWRKRARNIWGTILMTRTVSLSVHQMFGLLSSLRQNSLTLSSRGLTMQTHLVTVYRADFSGSGWYAVDSILAPDVPLHPKARCLPNTPSGYNSGTDRITAMDTPKWRKGAPLWTLIHRADMLPIPHLTQHPEQTWILLPKCGRPGHCFPWPLALYSKRLFLLYI